MAKERHCSRRFGVERTNSSRVLGKETGGRRTRWIHACMDAIKCSRNRLPGPSLHPPSRASKRRGDQNWCVNTSSCKVLPRTVGREDERRFQSRDSQVHLSSCGLRRRARLCAPLPLLLAVALACGGVLLTLPIGADGQPLQTIQPLAPDLGLNITEALQVPDQDCIFPYFERYSGACVRHRFVNGQSLYYHVPALPKITTAYVVLIHGAGVGRAEDWFVRINRIPMIKKFIGLGFGVAAVQSVGQWAMWARNRDLQNQDAAFWRVVEETGMRPDVPIFAVCVSRGCQYQGWVAETFARQGRPLKAQYLSIPWGMTPQFFARSAGLMPDTIVALGGADRVPMVNSQEQVEPWVRAISASGRSAQLMINEQSEVDGCFHRLCEMPGTGGRNMTEQLVRELKDTGVIDNKNFVAITLPAMQGVENPYEALIVDAYMRLTHVREWPVLSFNGPMVDWIYQELSEMQGGHRHTSDFDELVCRSFARHTELGGLADLLVQSFGGTPGGG